MLLNELLGSTQPATIYEDDTGAIFLAKKNNALAKCIRRAPQTPLCSAFMTWVLSKGTACLTLKAEGTPRGCWTRWQRAKLSLTCQGSVSQNFQLGYDCGIWLSFQGEKAAHERRYLCLAQLLFLLLQWLGDQERTLAEGTIMSIIFVYEADTLCNSHLNWFKEPMQKILNSLHAGGIYNHWKTKATLEAAPNPNRDFAG